MKKNKTLYHAPNIVLSIIIVTLGLFGGWHIYTWHVYLPEKRMVVIIPSYNNEQWCTKNLQSVFNQNYSNYRIIYIDDCSTDNTYILVKQLIEKSGKKNIVTLIRNHQRQGAMANWYHAIHSCNDHDIIINLDGDDWLAHSQVLQRVNQEYALRNAWLTYGQFHYHPTGKIGYGHELPDSVKQEMLYRGYPVVPTHLRTFYAWLFKKIKKEDCMYEGQFFPATCDQAMMFPMLEMAGNHACFIPDVLYIYNQANPINDGKVQAQLVAFCESIVRSKSSYEQIKKEPLCG